MDKSIKFSQDNRWESLYRDLDSNLGIQLSVTDRFRTSLVATLGLLLCIILLAPGFMTFDSWRQLLEARNGIYSNWHPPLMAWIWHFMERVQSGPFGMLIFQLVLLWLGTILIFLQIQFSREWKRNSAMVISVFAPPIFSILGVIWKDSLFLSFAVLALGLLLYSRNHHTKTGMTMLALVGMQTCLVALLALRYNGVALVGAFALWGAVIYGQRWGRLKGFLIGVIMLGISFVGTITFNNSLATVSMYPDISLALFDVVGSLVRVETTKGDRIDGYLNDLKDIFHIEPNLTIDILQNHYRPVDWVYLIRHPQYDGPFPRPFEDGYTKEQANRIWKLWTAVVKDYPREWVMHRLNVASGQLGLPGSSLPGKSIFLSGLRKDQAEQLRLFPEQSTLQWVLSGFHKYVAKVLNRPVIFFVAAFGGLAFLLSKRRIRDRSLLFFLYGSALLHEVLLFIIAPAAQYRYSNWLVYAVTLALLLEGLAWTQKQKRPVGSNGNQPILKDGRAADVKSRGCAVSISW